MLIHSKNSLKAILIAFFIYLIPHFTYSQESTLKFKPMSVKEGLSQSTVFSILQDSKGFMWFGTRTGGLNKYDGYSFSAYKYQPDDSCSISGNEITALFEDSKGRIWVGTRNAGVNIFDYNTECFHHYTHHKDDPNSLKDNTVSQIYEDSKNRIWVATNGGLCLFNEEAKNFSNKMVQKGRSNTITAILERKDNLFWVGSKQGLYLYNAETDKFTYIKKNKRDKYSISGNYITALIFDEQGNLWVGTRNNGINRLIDEKTKKFVQIKHDTENNKSLISNIIRSLHKDKKGHIWIGTKNGVDFLSLNEQKKSTPTFTHFQNMEYNENSLSQNSIYSFLEDNRGNFWIGTWSGGVNYVNNDNVKFKHYKNLISDTNSLSNNYVSSFIQDGNQLWIATEGGGLNLFDTNNKTFKRYQTKDYNLLTNHVKALYIDQDNDFWVGTFQGLQKFDRETETFTTLIENQSIYTIQDGIEGELWIGTSKKLYRFDKKTSHLETYTYSKKDTSSIRNNTVNSIFKDSQGRLWFGTKKGLHFYNREQNNFTRYLHSTKDINSISNDHITSICEDLEGNLWVGTYDGLNKFDRKNNTFTLYGEKIGFPDNVVNGLVSDNLGNLWIATNKGLTQFNVSAASKSEDYLKEISKPIIYTKENYSFAIRNYDSEDGLQEDEFLKNSCYKNSKGELFFGGINGFNVFNPATIKDNTHIPNVAISKFKLFNKEVHPNQPNSPLIKSISETDVLNLTHKQSVFTFEFVALNYSSPEKNQYAYMMKGIDHSWNYIGNRREVTYTNLPAGEYTFMVKASNNDGIWNEEGTSVQVNILPPWWLTIWFKAAVALFVITSAISYYKYRTYALKQRQKELEIIVDERTHEVRTQAEELQAQRDHLDKQNKLISEINENMTASIKYAQTIQKATLPFTEMFEENFTDHFVLYRPKDIVSGDFYWAAEHGNRVFLGVIDCTGHGVPGAFMSMIGSSILNKIVYEQNLNETDEILEALDLEIRKALKQDLSMNDDGMDLVLCSFDRNRTISSQQIVFTGAKNSLYLFQKKEQAVIEIKGDRKSIGGLQKKGKTFTQTHMKLSEGDIIYLATDGMLDQNREDRKRLGKVRFMEILQSSVLETTDMAKQGDKIAQLLDEFQGDEKQRDDITLIGVKI